MQSHQGMKFEHDCRTCLDSEGGPGGEGGMCGGDCGVDVGVGGEGDGADGGGGGGVEDGEVVRAFFGREEFAIDVVVDGWHGYFGCFAHVVVGYLVYIGEIVF